MAFVEALTRATALSALVVLVAGVWSMAGDIEAQVRTVAEQLMCPVCEGRTVADSTAPLAAQMRELIREKLLVGESREQIIAYFVDRYGESILASPPRRGFNWVLWITPFLVAGLGGAVLVGRLRQWVSGVQEDAARDADPLDPVILSQLEHELEEFDRGS